MVLSATLDVEFKPLLMKERALADELLRLRQMHLLGIDVEGEIENYEERLKKAHREIVEKAHEKIPGFTDIAKKLGLNNDDTNAMSALAGLLIYLRWPYEVLSFHRAKRLLGLYKPTREEVRRFEERSGEKYRKRYSGCGRRYLGLLTAAILVKKRVSKPRMRHQREVLRRLLNILRTYSDGADASGGAGLKP